MKTKVENHKKKTGQRFPAFEFNSTYISALKHRNNRSIIEYVYSLVTSFVFINLALSGKFFVLQFQFESGWGMVNSDTGSTDGIRPQLTPLNG